ncbi:MAG: DUF4129 domain-containing protein [Gemmataceae bacterium]
MATSKPRSTLADYMIIAISPALIIGLVASLVFFLVAILYEGDFTGRLRWILFFFVFGAVLVARIALEDGISERAPIYGMILAAATWIGLNLFVEYPGDTPLSSLNWLINLGFVVLVWWCAHKLTRDCTYIDDNVEASGQGLLQATGIESGEEGGSESVVEQEEQLTWWERYQRFREARKKRHTPGTWVVYFSLAALPIFGLGQTLIPPEDGDRRFGAFLLMATYTASGLGLLLTTCFLGLRRYLRQRRIQMPVAMAGTWLGIGTALIAVLLLLGAFMPRPQSETPLVNLDSVAGGERQASDYAVKGDSPAKGDGSAATEPGKDNKDGKPGSNGEIDNKQGGDAAKSDKPSDPSGGGDGQKGNSGNSKQGNQPGNSKNASDSSNGKDKQDSSNKGAKDNQSSGGGKGTKSASSSSSKSSKGRKATSSSSSWTSKLPHSLQGAAKALQWIVIGLLVVGVVVLVLWKGLAFLANFTQWARSLLEALRNLWARLFGGSTSERAESLEVERAVHFKRPRPFTAFRNPFLDGSADARSPAELVRYSFAALQAWAFEQGLGRSPEETPLEFVGRLGQELPALETDSQKLAILLVRVEYGKERLPAKSVHHVQEFWRQLEALAEQPLSA